MPRFLDSAVCCDLYSWCKRMTENHSRKKEMGAVGRVEMEGVRCAKGEVCRKDWVRDTNARVKRVP